MQVECRDAAGAARDARPPTPNRTLGLPFGMRLVLLPGERSLAQAPYSELLFIALIRLRLSCHEHHTSMPLITKSPLLGEIHELRRFGS